MFRQSQYCNKIFNWYNKDIKGFNNNPTWLFYKIFYTYILKFHPNVDSKIFLCYNKGARYARERYITKDVGTIQ